jgi:hypothetical protein
MVRNPASKGAGGASTQEYAGSPSSVCMKVRELPWTTVTLLVLILIFVLALWGRLPSRQHVLRERVLGNVTSVVLRARLR